MLFFYILGASWSFNNHWEGTKDFLVSGNKQGGVRLVTRYALRASPSSSDFGRFCWKFIWTLRLRTAQSGLGTHLESILHHLRTRCYVREESDFTASEQYGSVGHLLRARFSCGSLCNIEYGHPIEGCGMGYKITPHHVIFVARRRIPLTTFCCSACSRGKCGSAALLGWG